MLVWIDEGVFRSHGDLDAYAVFQDYRGSEPIFRRARLVNIGLGQTDDV